MGCPQTPSCVGFGSCTSYLTYPHARFTLLSRRSSPWTTPITSPHSSPTSSRQKVAQQRMGLSRSRAPLGTTRRSYSGRLVRRGSGSVGLRTEVRLQALALSCLWHLSEAKGCKCKQRSAHLPFDVQGWGRPRPGAGSSTVGKRGAGCRCMDPPLRRTIQVLPFLLLLLLLLLLLRHVLLFVTPTKQHRVRQQFRALVT